MNDSILFLELISNLIKLHTPITAAKKHFLITIQNKYYEIRYLLNI